MPSTSRRNPASDRIEGTVRRRGRGAWRGRVPGRPGGGGPPRRGIRRRLHDCLGLPKRNSSALASNCRHRIAPTTNARWWRPGPVWIRPPSPESGPRGGCRPGRTRSTHRPLDNRSCLLDSYQGVGVAVHQSPGTLFAALDVSDAQCHTGAGSAAPTSRACKRSIQTAWARSRLLNRRDPRSSPQRPRTDPRPTDSGPPVAASPVHVHPNPRTALHHSDGSTPPPRDLSGRWRTHRPRRVCARSLSECRRPEAEIRCW